MELKRRSAEQMREDLDEYAREFGMDSVTFLRGLAEHGSDWDALRDPSERLGVPPKFAAGMWEGLLTTYGGLVHAAGRSGQG